MKTNKILKIVLIGLLFIGTAGFVYLQQSTLVQEKQQLIIGTWVIDGESTNKWIFSNSSCKWEFEGVVTDEFNYVITSELSSNGAEHPYVKLTAVNSEVMEAGESVEYAINGLGTEKMILGIIKPKVSYIHFTKQ